MKTGTGCCRLRVPVEQEKGQQRCWRNIRREKKIGLDQKWHSHTCDEWNEMEKKKKRRRIGIEWKFVPREELAYIHAVFSLTLVTFSPPSLPDFLPFFSFEKPSCRTDGGWWCSTQRHTYTDGEMGQIRTNAFYKKKKNWSEREKNEKDGGRVLVRRGGDWRVRGEIGESLNGLDARAENWKMFRVFETTATLF